MCAPNILVPLQRSRLCSITLKRCNACMNTSTCGKPFKVQASAVAYPCTPR
jgi:hypothetical protein